MSENDSLSPKQQRLIACLLEGQSIVKASHACGIAEKTAHRWLKDPAFQTAYQTAKQQAFDEALSLLQYGVKAAIATLARNMKEDQPPAVQVRAAVAWLEQAITLYRGHEMDKHIAAGEIAMYLPQKRTFDELTALHNGVTRTSHT